jgi:ATP-dependent Clp endopeptidase proteolytic subunit ClpP
MAKKWVAVEQHDDSECDPCSAIDGTTYANRADAYADYPGGVGYKDCIGAEFGNACRGRVQKRRAKNHQGDQGMTDVSLLREFRARLAERAAIQPAALKPATPKGKDWFRIENLSADEASIYIFDEIGMWGTSAQGFVDQLNAVTSPKITVYLNSPGGEVFDGIAIHTALAMSKAHVTTFVTGVAASAASFIAMAGDTIKMARNATMMIHEASGLAWGNKRTMRQEADLLEKLDGNIADMYAMQAGGEVADWLAAMEAETWYTGQEALAAGLIDEISNDDADDPDDPPPANRLSLALFNYAGRAEAPAPGEIAPPPETPAVEDAPEEDLLPDLEDGEMLLNSGFTQHDRDQAMLLLAGLMKG